MDTVRKTKSACLFLLLLMGCFHYQGCSRGNNPFGPQADSQVNMSFGLPPRLSETTSEYITRATITVTASDIVEPITSTLTAEPWKVSLTIPSGNSRKISAQAITNLSNTYTGFEIVDLQPAEVKNVTLYLTLNHTPVISSITSTYSNIPAASGTTTLTCNATDADGDTLTYTWSVSPNKGSLSNQSANTIQYTADSSLSSSGTYTFTCAVDDGKGGTAQSSTSITVSGAVTMAMPPRWW